MKTEGIIFKEFPSNIHNTIMYSLEDKERNKIQSSGSGQLFSYLYVSSYFGKRKAKI